MPNHSAESLWLPQEIWAMIARFLDIPDLASFRKLCKATELIALDSLR